MALNEHKNLDSDNLHVSKGFTAASENTFQTKDERGATYWQANNYLPACLDVAVSTSAPPTETDGAIYLLDNSGAPHANWDACTQTQWVRYRSSDGIWEGVTPSEGYLCYDKDTNVLLRFDGAAWGSSSSAPSIGGGITSGTTGSVLFVGAGATFAQDNTNFFWDDTNNRLGIGIAAPTSRLHIKAIGATNATSSFLLEDSAGVDFFKFLDDGTFFLGKAGSVYDSTCVGIGTNVSVTSGANTVIGGGGASNGGSGGSNTVIGYGASGSSGNQSVSIGYLCTQGGGAQQPISIGAENNQNSDYTISIGTYTGGVVANKLAAYDTAIGTFIMSNCTTASAGRNVMIGRMELGYTAGMRYSVLIGQWVKGEVDITASKGYNIGIGSFINVGGSVANQDHGILIFGTGDGTNYLTNSENNSMIIGMNDQYESFKMYKRGVFVFNGANAASVVDGTNVDASCTNTWAIPSGTAPVSAVANTAQIFSNDSGQLSYLDENGFTITL